MLSNGVPTFSPPTLKDGVDHKRRQKDANREPGNLREEIRQEIAGTQCEASSYRGGGDREENGHDKANRWPFGREPD